MAGLDSERALRKIPELQEQAHRVARGLHEEVLQGGRPARQVADFLHGRWLQHPLHVALTDATVGAWFLGSVLDCIGLALRHEGVEKCADRLIDVGNATAVPTALSGLADFTTIPEEAMASGATHGLLNACGFVCNLLSAGARKSGLRPLGVLLSAVATGGLLASAWLGGEMVYRYKVGVNRTRKPAGPQDWQPVLNENELPEGQPMRVEVMGAPILLYRHRGVIHAMGAVCGHAAGALDEGTFEDAHVTCPLHQSVYDLRDGSVVHSPSLYPEPTYDIRVREGKIELKSKSE
ncbi:MAG: Rieske 2Fe-2S domain-containing protein [Planctomycetes bacterium]|nr:Rieske 2Fe-2S domain-containing protein [Planctomycetota bacterium]